jgi:MFS family permease
MTNPGTHRDRWYEGITRYQWLVLVLASLGWVFDVYEGQIFVANMNEAMPALLGSQVSPGAIAFYNNITFAAFLVGGAVGGALFGMLSDRIGRKCTLSYTILTYTAFTGLSALAQAWWHMAALRFLVALGVGGEWAVASALVAETFPTRARAWSQSIFHASSVLGTYLATAGTWLLGRQPLDYSFTFGNTTWLVSGWRLSFVLGVLPAVLIVWVRRSLREPEYWLHSRKEKIEHQAEPAAFTALLTRPLLGRLLMGVGLATVGLATFWGTHIYGKDMLREAYKISYLATLPADADADSMATVLNEHAADIKNSEMLGMFLVTTGGGLGLVCFGPISERLGRRGAFLLFHAGGLIASLILFQVLTGLRALLCFLPIFGFLTLAMHAGYAVYFPELFPTRWRGAGGGICFNGGRILAAPILFLGGWMQKDWGFSLGNAASLLALLFLPGAILLLFAPETKGRDLPT